LNNERHILGTFAISDRPLGVPFFGKLAAKIFNSAPDSKFRNQLTISLKVVLLEVFQKASPFSNHHQQPPSRVVVLSVNFKVLGEVIDPLGKNRDLHIRRA
jgi:hypothetical protein